MSGGQHGQADKTASGRRTRARPGCLARGTGARAAGPRRGHAGRDRRPAAGGRWSAPWRHTPLPSRPVPAGRRSTGLAPCRAGRAGAPAQACSGGTGPEHRRARGDFRAVTDRAPGQSMLRAPTRARLPTAMRPRRSTSPSSQWPLRSTSGSMEHPSPSVEHPGDRRDRVQVDAGARRWRRAPGRRGDPGSTDEVGRAELVGQPLGGPDAQVDRSPARVSPGATPRSSSRAPTRREPHPARRGDQQQPAEADPPPGCGGQPAEPEQPAARLLPAATHVSQRRPVTVPQRDVETVCPSWVARGTGRTRRFGARPVAAIASSAPASDAQAWGARRCRRR